MTTDDARLVEIEAREQAATPGPWRLDTARIYALTTTGAREVAVVTKADPIVRANAAHNGDFIAHSRGDVRYLLDRLKAANERRYVVRKNGEVHQLSCEHCDAAESRIRAAKSVIGRWESYDSIHADASRALSQIEEALHSDEVQEEGNGGGS